MVLIDCPVRQDDDVIATLEGTIYRHIQLVQGAL